jgi:prepilin-type N-terminal cleavage/methylation domain-containing protein/prepilin-type processing-associated H-X9-DG protein
MHQFALARSRTGSVSRCHRSSIRHGFTLVELLVVIGIIALLISVLLPTLASARRSANSVKCLASLKEIGNAFSMYAIDNKGMYPAVRDNQIKSSTGGALDRRWTDYISKYISKKGQNFTGSQDVSQIRAASVLWGCPEFAKTFEFDATKANWHSENVYTGYAMNPYPAHPYDGAYPASTYGMRNNATRQGYLPQSMYGRKGAERILVADSTYDYIQLPPNGYTNNTKFAPFDVLNPAAPADDFYVDARHMKPGSSKQAAKAMTPVNALFADGHAASVSPKQAYDAVRSPSAGSIVAAGVK